MDNSEVTKIIADARNASANRLLEEFNSIHQEIETLGLLYVGEISALDVLSLTARARHNVTVGLKDGVQWTRYSDKPRIFISKSFISGKIKIIEWADPEARDALFSHWLRQDLTPLRKNHPQFAEWLKQ